MKNTQAVAMLGPYVASANFSYDITGTPDSRPGTWGDAGVEQISDPFKVPAGYSQADYNVRILRIYGDFIAWPHGPLMPSPGAKVPFAGVLWGLTNTTPTGSPEEVYGAQGCFLYLQQGVNALQAVRAPFDLDVSAGGLLNSDATMISKVAVFLNEITTAAGAPCSIHVEVTFVAEFQFELTAAPSTTKG